MLKRILAAAIAAATLSTVAYAEDFAVHLDSLAAEDTQAVSFDGTQPVNADGTLFVPIRAVCEAAGMTVSWYQPAKTATITLKADANSELPVERYAYSLLTQEMEKIGLDVEPTDIILRLAADVSTMDVRYNYTDTVNNDIVALGKVITVDNAPKIVNSSVMIPVRAVMEAFELDVSYDSATGTATVSIPESLYSTETLKIMPAFEVLPDTSADTTVTAQAETSSSETDGMTIGESLGTFKVTYYCSCAQCNGAWGGNTAYAGKITPGRTVGASLYTLKNGFLHKLQWIYIDGIGFRCVEDVGTGLDEPHIDVAVTDHNNIGSYTVGYREVWAVN